MRCGELDAVIATQGEGVCILASALDQCLGDLDDRVIAPIRVQAFADGGDGIGIGGGLREHRASAAMASAQAIRQTAVAEAVATAASISSVNASRT